MVRVWRVFACNLPSAAVKRGVCGGREERGGGLERGLNPKASKQREKQNAKGIDKAQDTKAEHKMA